VVKSRVDFNRKSVQQGALVAQSFRLRLVRQSDLLILFLLFFQFCYYVTVNVIDVMRFESWGY